MRSEKALRSKFASDMFFSDMGTPVLGCNLQPRQASAY
jgi:hypothetical protein